MRKRCAPGFFQAASAGSELVDQHSQERACTRSQKELRCCGECRMRSREARSPFRGCFFPLRESEDLLVRDQVVLLLEMLNGDGGPQGYSPKWQKGRRTSQSPFGQVPDAEGIGPRR